AVTEVPRPEQRHRPEVGGADEPKADVLQVRYDVVERQVGVREMLPSIGRGDRARPATECREMAARARDLRKEVTAPAAIPGQLGRRGVGEEAHEVVGKV